MSIADDHALLQRQLYLLGYSHALPADGVGLVSTLLRDLQAALDRVKELETTNTRLEREERTSRAGLEKSKGELHALRTDNNSLRAQVLSNSREADRLRRDARADTYELGKVADDLRMTNLQLKAEHAETQRALDDCKRRLEARLNDQDPGGRIARMTTNGKPPPSMTDIAHSTRVQPAIIDLVDLSSRRIAALEHEIDHLEEKLAACSSDLKATNMDVKERDLELLRLRAEYDRIGAANAPSTGVAQNDSNEVSRLTDQIDYLHDRAEALERENKEQRDQFAREKDALHGRLIAAENDRVSSAISLPTHAAPANTDEAERLRTECANIKSLYAQTRDQLQELLRSGNAEARQAQEQARLAEKNSLAAVRDLPELRDIAAARAKQIAGLERKLQESESTKSAEITRLSDQLAQANRAQAGAEQSLKRVETLRSESVAEFQQLVDQHRSVSRSLKQAVAEVAEWRAKADDREHRLNELSRRADEYKMLYRQHSSELRACKRTLDAYTSDLATLRETQANAQREAETLAAELEQAVRLRRAVEMSKDEYKAGLAKALAESDAHRSLIEHLQAERSALRVQVKAQFHLTQRLEQRLESLDPSSSTVPGSTNLQERQLLSSMLGLVMLLAAFTILTASLLLTDIPLDASDHVYAHTRLNRVASTVNQTRPIDRIIVVGDAGGETNDQQRAKLCGGHLWIDHLAQALDADLISHAHGYSIKSTVIDRNIRGARIERVKSPLARLGAIEPIYKQARTITALNSSTSQSHRTLYVLLADPSAAEYDATAKALATAANDIILSNNTQARRLLVIDTPTKQRKPTVNSNSMQLLSESIISDPSVEIMEFSAASFLQRMQTDYYKYGLRFADRPCIYSETRRCRQPDRFFWCDAGRVGSKAHYFLADEIISSHFLTSLSRLTISNNK
ncbi:hypothetical protein GGI02_003312 [Coemansia sp. RSA 2322]|nr:hypothetical protein GGI02_003312 [Coemansia sp. RSA 2322]